MEPTGHLFFLICYAFKHSLHSGYCIQQVCDIVLFANQYGQEIDWRLVLVNYVKSMRIILEHPYSVWRKLFGV